jgi:hypothetical protein
VSIEISDAMVQLIYERINFVSHDHSGIREGLADVLALPEVRQAIHAEVQREKDQNLRDMGVTGYTLEWDR